MNVERTEHRVIVAAPAAVGALLDELGSPHDRLWPIDRWPTMPFERGGPLAAGVHAQHGPIRYEVETYEPGRRLRFRFAPGLGLAGTHGFDVEALGDGRTRLTHTLQATVKARMLPLWPVLRGYHDALSKDILAQAERAATGRPVQDPRWPRWLRVVNGADARLASRRTRRSRSGSGARLGALARPAGLLVPAVLVGIAAVHVGWALGMRWPGDTELELAERVVGAAQMPPTGAILAVAVALGGAAAIVHAAANRPPTRTLHRLAWVVAGVLLARGLLLIPLDLVGGIETAFERLDITIYSPLCLALGVGAAAVARRAEPAPGTTDWLAHPAAP